MKDSVIKGNGDSRYLKSIEDFLTEYPTYADFAAALAEGSLPIDFNGINPNGFVTVGDALNKANLFPDETAINLGLDPADNPQVKDGFDVIMTKFGYEHHDIIETSGEWTVPDGVKQILVMIVGGGGGGAGGEGASSYSNTESQGSHSGGGGGGGGHINIQQIPVKSQDIFTVEVGGGGAGGEGGKFSKNRGNYGTNGQRGGTSKFYNDAFSITAAGGQGGNADAGASWAGWIQQPHGGGNGFSGGGQGGKSNASGGNGGSQGKNGYESGNKILQSNVELERFSYTGQGTEDITFVSAFLNVYPNAIGCGGGGGGCSGNVTTSAGPTKSFDGGNGGLYANKYGGGGGGGGGGIGLGGASAQTRIGGNGGLPNGEKGNDNEDDRYHGANGGNGGNGLQGGNGGGGGGGVGSSYYAAQSQDGHNTGGNGGDGGDGLVIVFF